MVTPSRDSILVIGAGVSGLTSAICLAEAGLPVRVISQHAPLRTPSGAAGASWGLYLVEEDDDRTLGWGRQTFAEMEQLSTLNGAGVRMVDGLEAHRAPATLPRWTSEVRNFRVCDPAELPPGFKEGWRYTIPIVHMPSYLGYLTERLANSGVKVELATVGNLTDLDAETILNCAGIGARQLAGDDDLIGVRGDLVVVENPGVDWFFHEGAGNGTELTYWLPHGDTVALGGSASPTTGSLAADPAVAAGIVERCAAIEPRFTGARVIDHRVGVRPVRPTVRVEQSLLDGQKVIHNYGHGGSGVTLSWGCAREIVSMILD